jgi:hypothetical protein
MPYDYYPMGAVHNTYLTKMHQVQQVTTQAEMRNLVWRAYSLAAHIIYYCRDGAAGNRFGIRQHKMGKREK